MNEPRGAQEDRANVDRVLAGDVAAFEPIVRRWQKDARQFSVALLPRPRPCRGDGAGSFSTRLPQPWSVATGVRFLHLALRSCGQRISVRTEMHPSRHALIDDIAEPVDLRISNTLETTDRAESIRRAVLALPEKYRDAIFMYYFHEQDVPTAALTLSIPEGTVKARLFRGRELLRKKFSQARGMSRTANAAAPLSKEAR